MDGEDTVLHNIVAPSLLSVFNEGGEEVVRIESDGTLVMSEKYSCDAAAKKFWEAVSQYAPPVRCPHCGKPTQKEL